MAISGPPVEGNVTEGDNAYEEVIAAPTEPRVYTRLYITMAEKRAAWISLDGGTTDHFFVEGGKTVVLEGLWIPSGSAIHAKNAETDASYDRLHISAW